MTHHASNAIAKHAAAGATRALSQQQLTQYREQGFVYPVPAIGREMAQIVRQKIESVEARSGGVLPKHMFRKSHLLFTWLDQVVRHPTVLDAVEDILGPDILCWSSNFFLKSPNDGGFVPWHQDVTYWGLNETASIVTAWVALTPATKLNGVMKVVPGSHRELVRHNEGVVNSMLGRGQEIAVEVDESDAVFMELEAGEMSLHHALMFHSSEENRSTDRRLGFAVRYIPTRNKPLDGLPRDNASLVRGTDSFGYFDLETPPSADLDAAAVEQHRAVCARYMEIHDQTARLRG